MPTSPTAGALVIVDGVSAMSAATMCLVTAFLDPATATSPRSGPEGSMRQASAGSVRGRGGGGVHGLRVPAAGRGPPAPPRQGPASSSVDGVAPHLTGPDALDLSTSVTQILPSPILSVRAAATRASMIADDGTVVGERPPA